ncbi:hypothetical protein VTI74DRAFT_7343 [Chaetomium olivicolor]
MRATFALLSGLVALASAGPCRPKTTTTAALATSTTATSTEETTIISSSTVSTSIAEITTTAPEPETTSTTVTETTETSTSTTSAAETSTTSAAPQPTAILGFCLKAASSDMPNYGNHIAYTSPYANLVMTKPNNPSFPTWALFNLDLRTGALTLNSTASQVLQAYALGATQDGPYNVIRLTSPSTGAATSWLTCSNPDGTYTSGSILKCDAMKQWSTGPAHYTIFRTSSSSSATIQYPWSIVGAVAPSTAQYDYDVAMYFNNDCLN